MKWQHLQTLPEELETLQIKPRELVNKYFSRTSAIASKMRLHGDKMEDVIVIENILWSITTNCNYVICSIKMSQDIYLFQLMNSTIHCLSMNKKFKSETEAEEEKREMKFIILKKKGHD